MNVDLDIQTIESNLRFIPRQELVNFDSHVVIGDAVYLILGDKLAAVEHYKSLLSLGAQA
jgi:hypothetical protein